ncbi:MAG: AsmA family protein [Pseudomonadota bacterium]|nr:AsmA family protein [Pseudomonadota bacterium]MDE3037475.1 AsmA family protein [Pseudomonadota bacterium]
MSALPESHKRSLLSTSKTAIGACAAVLLVLGLILVAQGFIDARDYRARIIQAIKAETGRDATIKGKVSVWLLPLPTIYVPNVQLRDVPGNAPSVSVEMMKLRVPVAALFSNHLRVSAIVLQSPKIDLARAADHRIHWDWLNPRLFKVLLGAGNADAPLSITLKDGVITYQDENNGKGVTAGNVNAVITVDHTLAADGDFTLGGHMLRADIHTRSAPPPATPLTADFYADGKHALQWNGLIDLSGSIPKIQGKIVFSVDDALSLVQNKSPGNQPGGLPLALTGDWSQEGDDITLANLRFKGLGSEGTGKASLAWKGWQPFFAADVHFSAFDYSQWKTLLTAAVMPADVATAENDNDNPLPAHMQLSLHLAADRLLVGAQVWKNASLSADLAEASVTINQFNVALPGESTFTLFGIISRGATGGLRFEGDMETGGQSLRRMLTAFDASASGLPEAGFGVFHVRSNLFISSEQMRLSEADMKLSDLHLIGGLVAYFDVRKPRVEADIKLKDINFDYFRNVWRARQQKKAGQPPAEDVLTIDKGKSFDWLKSLQATVDFKVAVDGFTFLDRKGSNATFRLFARQGEFGIYDIRFHYPDGTTEASFDLNVTNDQPAMNVMLNTRKIDTGYFSVNPLSGKEKTADTPPVSTDVKIWPTALIDMSWMEGVSGNFDLSIGTLTHGALSFGDFKLQARLKNDLLTLQNCNFTYWQGRWSVLGSIYGGAVPGVAVSFTLFNAELHDILHRLIGRDNISGRVSVSGTLNTSGVNVLSWVSQADAKLVIAARGVSVGGVNLQGVVHAVSVSRTAADVFNNANRALVDGSSIFDVDGNINVEGGIMGTPGITLKSGAIIGNLTGEARLVPWTMDMSTLFQFPAMTSDTIPTMTIQLVGPIGAPALKTDTSSLEAYVTKRITSN